MGTRLVAIGDGVTPTGIARIVHSVLRRLPKDEYEIHHLAHNYRGDPHDEAWRIYPAAIGGPGYGFRRVRELVRLIQPQIVWLVNDLWIQDKYLEILNDCAGGARIVTYSPVEGPPVDSEWLQHAERVDRFVVFSEFAREEILKTGGVEIERLSVIPPGIDTDAFHPLQNRTDREGGKTWKGGDLAKERLGIVTDGNFDESFVVLNANRNQPRKRIDLTMRIFAEFARRKPPGVKLYLHMGTEDVGWNVFKLARRYGIDKRLIISENPNTIPSVPDASLNWIYNACDVGINTAACEGWGLVSFEHAACRRAQLVPRLPSLLQIWEGACEFLETGESVVFEKTLVDGRLVNTALAAGSLERLYSRPDQRARLADAGMTRVIEGGLRWADIGRLWDELFRELVS